jgi:hypothetical protein
MSLKIRLVLKVRIAAAIVFALLALSAEARALPLWPAVHANQTAAASFWTWLTSQLLPGSNPSALRPLALPAGCGMDPNGYDPCPNAVSPEHPRPIAGIPLPRQR